jgi:hypothetical protein
MMSIPALNDDGLLPPGIYDCEMAEIQEQFASSKHSAMRRKLFVRLREYVRRAGRSEEIVELIVDGSFITAKEEPQDIDLLVATRKNKQVDVLLPVDYNLVSRKRVAREFKFDVLAAPSGSRAFQIYVDLFRQVKGQPGLEKGLLRVKP